MLPVSIVSNLPSHIMSCIVIMFYSLYFLTSLWNWPCIIFYIKLFSVSFSFKCSTVIYYRTLPSYTSRTSNNNGSVIYFTYHYILFSPPLILFSYLICPHPPLFCGAYSLVLSICGWSTPYLVCKFLIFLWKLFSSAIVHVIIISSYLRNETDQLLLY